MREIRLKLWCKERKSWVGIDKIYFGESAELCCVETDDKELYFPDEKNFELVNYTGLKDKNGVYIYEGDIIEFVPFETSINNRVVKFERGVFKAELIRSGSSVALFAFQESEIKVIGNIYENNDLI